MIGARNAKKILIGLSTVIGASMTFSNWNSLFWKVFRWNLKSDGQGWLNLESFWGFWSVSVFYCWHMLLRFSCYSNNLIYYRLIKGWAIYTPNSKYFLLHSIFFLLFSTISSEFPTNLHSFWRNEANVKSNKWQCQFQKIFYKNRANFFKKFFQINPFFLHIRIIF